MRRYGPLLMAVVGMVLVGALAGCGDTVTDPDRLPALTKEQLARSAAIPTGTSDWEQIRAHSRAGYEGVESVVERMYRLRGDGDPVDTFLAFAAEAHVEGVMWQLLDCSPTGMSLNGTELIDGETATATVTFSPDDRRLTVNLRSADKGSSGRAPDPEWTAFACSVEEEEQVRTVVRRPA